MQVSPFSLPGRFFRGNLHTHSTNSDGALTPEETCAFYRENGYDFLAVTDHFSENYGFPITDTRAYRKDGFTTILGAELHTGQIEMGQRWHILAVGLPQNFAPYAPDETGGEAAARALAAGAFVAAAHPAWYGLTEADILSLGPIHAMEVFNGTAVGDNDKSDSWMLADLMLSRGGRYTVCAVDDAHFKTSRHDSACGWVNVKAEAADPECLLEGLKAGSFYSSTGPRIHDINLEPGGKLTVRCSPAARVFVTGRGSASAGAFGNGIREAELNIESLSNSPYVRITVIDSHGGRAWSNPIWL